MHASGDPPAQPVDDVRLAAAGLLDFIGEVETGLKGPWAYETIIHRHERDLGCRLTSLTLDELTQSQLGWLARGWPSTAAGKYQILRSTLIDLKDRHRIRGDTVFDAACQDRLGEALLVRAGWTEAIAGTIDRNAFALRLARTWAGLPVLAGTDGHRRPVSRGESYYAGVGRNTSWIVAERFEQALAAALARAGRAG